MAVTVFPVLALILVALVVLVVAAVAAVKVRPFPGRVRVTMDAGRRAPGRAGLDTGTSTFTSTVTAKCRP